MRWWVAGLWALTACSAEPVTGSFAGEVAGGDAIAAVAINGDAAMAYVCGGPADQATHTRWFDTVTVDGTALTATQDGWTLEADVGDDLVEGVLIDPDGAELALTLDPATEGTLDGLYRGASGPCSAGLVVLGAESKVQGVLCNGAEAAQVVPVGQLALVDGGIEVQAETSDGPVEFVVSPVRP